MTVKQKEKFGDLLCDIGKYMLTVVPFTYFLGDSSGTLLIAITMVVMGMLIVASGLYFTKKSESASIRGNSRKRKIRVLKNSVFVVEEEHRP
ncbi:MAG: hypothetical protein IJT19_05400 [Bacteroidaceae bacterium]|nr:hypothetical protein [Bacteroidaceae bacterium]